MYKCLYIYVYTYSLKEKIVYMYIQFPDAAVKLADFFTDLPLWTNLLNTVSLGSQKFHICRGHLNF